MDDDSAEEDDAELPDGGARGTPQRRAFSVPGEPRVCAEAFGSSSLTGRFDSAACSFTGAEWFNITRAHP